MKAKATAKAKAQGGGALPFAEVRAGVERVVRATFPTAKASTFFGIDGWTIQRRKGAPMQMRPIGTMPPDKILVGLADRKAGPTLYVWYPARAGSLGSRRAELEAAGFKVMVGCLQFTKKAPYPFDAVEAHLRAIKKADASP